jgi:hypothetical protein
MLNGVTKFDSFYLVTLNHVSPSLVVHYTALGRKQKNAGKSLETMCATLFHHASVKWYAFLDTCTYEVL